MIDRAVALTIAVVLVLAVACGMFGRLPLHSQWTGGEAAPAPAVDHQPPVQSESGQLLGR